MIRGGREAGTRTAALILPALLWVGCSSFASPRSAVVRPGDSFAVQAALTPSTDEYLGWFWSLSGCYPDCDHAVGALDVSWTRSYEGDGGKPYTIAAGFNGILPYLESYWQLREGEDGAFGFGGRLGLSLPWWHEHRLFFRYDRSLGDETTLLVNPGVLLFAGNSPNGANPGTFAALTTSVGFEVIDAGGRAWVPAVGAVLGRGWRKSYGETLGPHSAWFVTASVSMVNR